VNPNDLPVHATAVEQDHGASLLSPLLQVGLASLSALREPATASPAIIPGVVIGELLALTDDPATVLVRFEGQPGNGAVPARSSVDLQGQHIGGAVVLMFERGDPGHPVVVGLLRGHAGWPLAEPPAQVEVDADGHRLVVNAREQLVLRCGKASITLTKAGKVLVEGSYLLSRSTGVNRIKGGSVQLN
jgi:Domain of unknown function (DUF6484)